MPLIWDGGEKPTKITYRYKNPVSMGDRGAYPKHKGNRSDWSPGIYHRSLALPRGNGLFDPMIILRRINPIPPQIAESAKLKAGQW
jgi:hypothetical protein